MHEPRRTSIGRQLPRFVLAVSMFVIGGCGLAYEYTLGVLGNNLLGSSHEQIFVVIGLMLFAMGLGAGVQRIFVGDLVDTFLWVEIALGVLGGASALLVYTAYVFTSSHQLVLYASATTIGVLIGCEIPLLIRIHESWARDLRTNLATTLALDYVGSLFGALLFAYGLITWFSVTRIATVLGLTNVALAVLGGLAFRRDLKRPRTLAVAATCATALLVVGFTRADRWTATLEQRAFADPIVHASTSRYQHIVLTEERLQRDNRRVLMFLDGQLQWSSRDEHIYHELLVHPAIALAPRPVERVLILGGGDGLAVREVLKHPTVRSVTLVDLDPAVIELARADPRLVELNGGALLDARVHAEGVLPDGSPGDTASRRIDSPTYRARQLGIDEQERVQLAEVDVFPLDADLFVHQHVQSGATFDAVLIDFPDPRRIELAKLYSVDFYRALAQHVAPEALVAVQSTSPWHARSVFLTIGETLRAAGFHAVPYHANVPSFGEWGFHLAWVARDRTTSRSVERAPLDRLDTLKQTDLPPTTRYLTPNALRAAFVFGKGWLDTDRTGPPRINTKMRPILHELYRRAWDD